MLLKLSNLNSNLALTLGYLNPALNNSALNMTMLYGKQHPLRLTHFSFDFRKLQPAAKHTTTE